MRDIFGFSEHQEKGTYGLGYKLLTLTKNNDNSALSKDKATAIRRIKINALEWYVPHYTPSLEDYIKLMTQIKIKTPTQLYDPKRSLFMKEINTQKIWTLS